MKLSFAIAVQDTKFESIARGQWRRKVALLSELGYDGIELAIRDPEKIEPDTIKRTLDKYGLNLSAIGTGQAYIDDGLSISSSQINIRKKAIRRLKMHIEFARLFNGQVIIGLIRGGKDVSRTIEFDEVFLDTLGDICNCAKNKGVVIAIEPINRNETNFLNTIDETLCLIKKTKCENLKMLLDTYHMYIEEKDMIGSIKRAKGYISHFHFADSNRRCPGEGSIDFTKVLSQIKEIGFNGYLSGEMLPLPTFDACAKNYIAFMRCYKI